MVSFKQIKASNALINDGNAPRVSVFVGGTAGIGKLAVRALVSTGAGMRIYLVGRASSAARTRDFIEELRTINPRAEVVWTEGEISLLAEVKRVCDVIKARESPVALLFLSAGYAPFGSRHETAEGIEITQSLEYYGRMLFALHFMPLLRAASDDVGSGVGGRVVSVLAGGLELACVDLDDMDMRRPENFGVVRSRIQYPAMNTTFLERLADANPTVTFIHACPGAVSTGNIWRGVEEGSWMAWVVWLVEPLFWLLSFSDEEAGQRHLFQSTSAAFGGRGIPWDGKPGVNSHEKSENGLFLVNSKSNCTPNSKVVRTLREKAMGKIWDHSQEILRPYL